MKNITAIIVSLFVANAYAAVPSPLASLSDAEKTYYEKVFDYSMDTVQGGGKYEWKSYSGNGAISIADTFVSKSGATCRNFTETFVVQGQNGIDKGVGCKRRGQDGWCKLDLNKAKTCSFEDTSRMFGGVGVDAPNVNVSAPNITVGPVNVPTVSGGSSASSSGGGVNSDFKFHSGSSGGSGSSGSSSGGGSNNNNGSGKSVADSVTGTAGHAASSATSTGISWFQSVFGR